MTTREAIEARLKATEAAISGGIAEPFSEWELEAVADLRTLLDLLSAVEAERDKAEEERNALAHFNPDWDMLRATQDSLREHMAALKAAQAKLAHAERLARAVREWQAAVRNAGGMAAWSDAAAKERTATSALLALDVPESS